VGTRRYLHFENFDLAIPCIAARCSACGREFTTDPMPGETLEDAVQRVRNEFDKHQC